MTIITASTNQSFDMYETAIGSALKPIFSINDAYQASIYYPGGFFSTLYGENYAFENDESQLNGTIFRILEYNSGMLQFSIEGLMLGASDLSGWYDSGDYTSFYETILSGNDSITGSDYSDRIFSQGGNDIIDSGAGNDEIDGGSGNNKVLAGAGDDWICSGSGSNDIDGGEGIDTVWYDILSDNAFISFTNNGTATISSNGQTDKLLDIEYIVIGTDALKFDTGLKIDESFSYWAGRKPRVKDIAFWNSDLADSGKEMVELKNYLLSSAEGYLHTISVIDEMYIYYTGRVAKSYEVSTWNTLLYDTSKFEDIRSTLLSHAEGYNYSSSMIASLYGTYVGRSPSISELASWNTSLYSGTKFSEVKNYILGLAEGYEHTVSSITNLYDTILGRSPTGVEIGSWNTLLYQGTNFENIRDFLIDSANSESTPYTIKDTMGIYPELYTYDNLFY